MLKKHSSTESRLRLVVNRAQAYKWSGDDGRARDILDKEDFSALNDVFKLAEASLRNNFTAALDIVKRIGKAGAVSIGDYREWPLFRELRKQANFEAVMLEVFGESSKVTVTAPQSGLSAELEPSTPRIEGTYSAEQPTTPDIKTSAIEESLAIPAIDAK